MPTQDPYLCLIYAQSRSLFVFGICPVKILICLWYLPSQDSYLYLVYAQSSSLFVCGICPVKILICIWYMPSQVPYLYVVYAQSRFLFVFGICPFHISDLYLVYTISFMCFGLIFTDKGIKVQDGALNGSKSIP